MKCCEPFDHECMPHMWVCGACRPKTLNSNARDACKECSHLRCDNPSVKRIPFKEEGGVRIVSVDMKRERDKSKVN
jgi:hypothetical protein